MLQIERYIKSLRRRAGNCGRVYFITLETTTTIDCKQTHHTAKKLSRSTYTTLGITILALVMRQNAPGDPTLYGDVLSRNIGSIVSIHVLSSFLNQIAFYSPSVALSQDARLAGRNYL